MVNIRFWLTGEYGSEEKSGIRGQYGDTQDDPQLYEIVREGNTWICLKWIYFITDPDGHGHQKIATGDVFECMAAAEKDAQESQEAENEW